MGANQSIDSESVLNRHYTVEQLQMLRGVAEKYMLCGHHLKSLKREGTSHPGNEENPSPWYTVKEGSYYLNNVYSLMETYMEYNPYNIYDENMKSVIDTMTALGYHPKYNTAGYTDEAYGGKAEVFISKGKGTMYHKLLYSKYRKDINFFVEMVERDIDIPIQKFLQSIKMELSSRNIFD